MNCPGRGHVADSSARLGQCPGPPEEPQDGGSLGGRGSAVVPRPGGHSRHPAAGVGAAAPAGGRIRRSGRTQWLRAAGIAHLRGRWRVQALGPGQRDSDQGAVRVLRQGRPSPASGPSARADGQRVPGVRRTSTDASVEDLVLRPPVPLRASSGRPLPAVRAGRGGDPRHRRPPRRRGGDQPGSALLRGPRDETGAPADQQPRRFREPPRLRGRAGRLPPEPARRVVGAVPSDPETQSAAGARLQAGPGPARDRGGAPHGRLSLRRFGGALRGRARRPRQPRRGL